MDKLNQMKQYLNTLDEDFTKFFDRGNNAAGTRVRKAMQDLKKMANDIRTAVQEKKAADKA